MKPSILRTVSITGLAAGLSLLTVGCAGHGKYTTEHKNRAIQTQQIMKAGTEWTMAQQAFLAGDLDKAMRRVDTSLSMNDSVPKSHVLKGRILIEKGDLGLALKSLQTAAAIDPEFVDAQYYLGVVHERLLQPMPAADYYKAAAALDPYNAQYAVAAAEMMIDIGQRDEARAYLNAHPGFDHAPGIKQSLGHLAMLANNPETAAQYFQEARLLAPDDGAILEDLIRAQVESADYATAEYNLSVLLEDPNFAERRDLLHMQARCLIRVGRPVEARDVFLTLTSDSAGASDLASWIGLGNVSYVLRDGRNLRRAATRVVALAPKRHDGYALWGLLHRQNGDYIKSLASFNDAISFNNTDSTLHTFRALTLLDLERFNDSAKAFQTALMLDPNNVQLQRLAAAGAQKSTSGFAAVETP